MNPQTERRHPASVLFCPVPTPYVSSPDAGAPLVEQEAEPPVSDPAPVWDPAKYCSWCDMDHNKNPKLHPEGVRTIFCGGLAALANSQHPSNPLYRAER